MAFYKIGFLEMAHSIKFVHKALLFFLFAMTTKTVIGGAPSHIIDYATNLKGYTNCTMCSNSTAYFVRNRWILH